MAILFPCKQPNAAVKLNDDKLVKLLLIHGGITPFVGEYTVEETNNVQQKKKKKERVRTVKMFAFHYYDAPPPPQQQEKQTH